MKKYQSLLPNYLDGENIRRHAEIIDMVDHELYDALNTLASWSSLKRPILIQREAKDIYSVNMNVYVNVPQNISRVIVKGDVQEEHIFNEDEYMQTTTIPLIFQNSENGLHMPEIQVTVETYDDITYTKSYPENDQTVGDTGDHDEFLDRIGNMLGIPRRIYKEYPVEHASKTTPRYMGKQVNDNVVQPCTEDDYYYYKRIQYYLENFNKTALPVLLLQTIYGYNDVTELNMSTVADDSRWDYVYDALEGDLPSSELAGIYIFLVNRYNPVNIQSLTDEEKRIFMEKYIPVTRRAYLLPQILTNITIHKDFFPKEYTQIHSASVIDENNNEVINVPVTFLLDGEKQQTNTDTTGTATVMYQGVGFGYHTVSAEIRTGRGYEGNQDTWLYKSYFDDRQEYEEKLNINPGEQKILLNDIENDEQGVYIECLCDGEDYTVQLLGRQTLLDEWTALQTTNTLEGENHVGYLLSTRQAYNNQLSMESTTLDDDEYTYYALAVTNHAGTLSIDETWTTHYHPWGVTDADEFTILQYVNISEDSTTFPYLLGEGANGFRVDLLKYTPPGKHILEYKFLNYKAHLFIDGINTGCMYDFSNDTLTVGLDTDTPETTQYPSYNYKYMPGVLSKNYLVEITDYPGVPVHEGILESIIVIEDSVDYIDEITAAMNHSVIVRFLVKIYNRKTMKQINGYVHLQFTGYEENNSQNGINEDRDMKINGRRYIIVPGLDQAGTLRYTFQALSGWRREASEPVTKEVIIHHAPVTITTLSDYDVYDETEDVDIIQFPSSATRSIPVTIDVDVTPHKLNTEYPPTLGGELNIRYGDEIWDRVQFTTTGRGHASTTIQLPPQPTPTSKTIEIQYTGDKAYQPTEHEIPVLVTQNVQKIILLNDDINESTVATGDTCTLQLQILDTYNDPVQTTIVITYGASQYRGYFKSNTDGLCTIDVPMPETPTYLNLHIATTQTKYAQRTKKTIYLNVIQATKTATSLTATAENILMSTGTLIIHATLNTSKPLPNKTIQVLQDNNIIATGTTDTNGEVTITTNNINITGQNIEVTVRYPGETYYEQSTSTLTIPVINDIPCPADDFFNLTEWLTGRNLTALTTATTSTFTIDTTAQTITDKNTYFNVYSYTLEDYLQYYGDEFSFTIYKTGGDGRYMLGFIKKGTSNPDMIGYEAGSATCTPSNQTISLGEVMYQNYNEITFKKSGDTITVYWKNNSGNYVSEALDVTDVDLSEYYFFTRSTVRSGLTLTLDTSLIQNPSRQT